MKLRFKVALVVGVLTLTVAPNALAVSPHEGPPPHGKGQAEDKGPTYTPTPPPPPGPKDGLPAQAKAYGRYCKGESKKHVKGEKGTPFSRCVRNMAQASHQEHKSPGQVCKGESKEHVKGKPGTAFSRCVTAVAKLRGDQAEDALS